MKHIEFLYRAIYVLVFALFFPINAIGQNTVINGNRSIVGSLCVGSSATAVDSLSLCKAPVASTTRALLNLSNTALSMGSAGGTYLGANPAACTGDFLNLQLADAARAKLTCAGALTVVSSTNNLSIFAATTSAQLAGVISDKTGSGVLVYGTNPTLTSPIIADIAPGADFTLTQNAVTPFVSVNANAVANTLHLNSGRIGIGGLSISAYALYLSGANTTGANQVGFSSQTTFSSAATGLNYGTYAAPITAAAAFTASVVADYYADNPVKGAGSTISSALGLDIADITVGTNNYGLRSAVSSGTNKWNVYASGNAFNYFAGSIGVGTTALPTGGATALAFANGTNPTGIAAATAGLFAKDVLGTGELFAFDSAGNFTQLSSHPADFLNSLPIIDRIYPWAYSAENVYLGKRIQVDMAGLVAAIERLSGEKFAYITDIPIQNWETNQNNIQVSTNAQIVARTQEMNQLQVVLDTMVDGEERQRLIRARNSVIIPVPYTVKPLPAWIAARRRS